MGHLLILIACCAGAAAQDDESAWAKKKQAWVLLAPAEVRAILDLKGTPKYTAMAYLANFEEVGSLCIITGAGSEFLSSTFAQLVGSAAGRRGTAISICGARCIIRWLFRRTRNDSAEIQYFRI